MDRLALQKSHQKGMPWDCQAIHENHHGQLLTETRTIMFSHKKKCFKQVIIRLLIGKEI